MILLSRLIKSHRTAELNEKKVISIRTLNRSEQGIILAPDTAIEAEKRALLANAAEQAQKLLAAARAEARFIQEEMDKQKNDWQEEKQLITEQAVQQGYEQGLRDGREKGFAEYRESIHFAAELVEASKADYQQRVESSERTILELGIKVAEKILGKTISDHEEEFIGIVKQAVKQARDARDVELHVNPLHYQNLLSHKDELLALFPKETNFYIFPDDDLSEESCLIESANGRMDASVDSQLLEVKQKLVELLESE
ncbi:flagellar assembly protein FliH [Bacillus canaveralius]|uniref:flagellar assembly protein FliH n=1 Tax=Bacillus canaveralius TaxID=1403243 RepID=UPI001FEBE9C3|nr:flagellar assembly protein FliH [Bacillus canaveralius]